MIPATGSKLSLKEKLWLAFGLLTIFVVTALLMRWEGRLWICACGSIKFWVSNTCSSDNSQHLLDPYSFTHVLHGFAFYWLVTLIFPRLKSNWQLLVAIALEAAWEVFENTNFVIERYRSVTAALGYTGDTIVNSFGDTLVLFDRIPHREAARVSKGCRCVPGVGVGPALLD